MKIIVYVWVCTQLHCNTNQWHQRLLLHIFLTFINTIFPHLLNMSSLIACEPRLHHGWPHNLRRCCSEAVEPKNRVHWSTLPKESSNEDNLTETSLSNNRKPESVYHCRSDEISNWNTSRRTSNWYHFHSISKKRFLRYDTPSTLIEPLCLFSIFFTCVYKELLFNFLFSKRQDSQVQVNCDVDIRRCWVARASRYSDVKIPNVIYYGTHTV